MDTPITIMTSRINKKTMTCWSVNWIPEGSGVGEGVGEMEAGVGWVLNVNK